MNKYYVVTFLIIILNMVISCTSKQKEGSEKSIYEIYLDAPEEDFSLQAYEDNSINIINTHRENLQTVLKISIHDILIHYKDLLKKIEKNKIYATSHLDHENYVLQIQNETFDSLVAKDIKVNLEYTKLLYDLEKLNHQYAKEYKIPIDSLHSYFDANKISLNEEVFLKINELINEDEERTKNIEKRERNEKYTDYAITAISFIPYVGPLAKIPVASKVAITQIHHGISSSMKNKALKEGAGKIAQFTFNLSSKSGNSNFLNFPKKIIDYSLSNNDKRLKISHAIANGTKTFVGSKAVKTVSNNIDPLNESNSKIKVQDLYKVIDNQLEGRIGDYSDGYTGPYIQELIDIAKMNNEVVKKYGKDITLD